MDFLFGFAVGGAVVGALAYFFGHKAGVAWAQLETRLTTAKKDLTK